MKRGIRLYGDEVLRRRAVEMGEVTPELESLVRDMFRTMYDHQGLGLAAPQIGFSIRVAVIDVPREKSGRIVLIDPEIISASGAELMEEGCLSFPEITAPVERAVEVEVEFTTLGGTRRRKKVSGVTAQAVQHEIDHLDGILLVDRMNRTRRTILRGRLRRLRKRGERGEER